MCSQERSVLTSRLRRAAKNRVEQLPPTPPDPPAGALGEERSDDPAGGEGVGLVRAWLGAVSVVCAHYPQ